MLFFWKRNDRTCSWQQLSIWQNAWSFTCIASTNFRQTEALFLLYLTLKVSVKISRQFVLPYTVQNKKFQILSQEAGRPKSSIFSLSRYNLFQFLRWHWLLWIGLYTKYWGCWCLGNDICEPASMIWAWTYDGEALPTPWLEMTSV